MDFILKAYENVRLPNEQVDIFNEDFICAISFWAVITIVAHFVFNPLFKTLFPHTWASLPPPKQKELSTYVLSTAHHVVVVPLVFYSVISDFLLYSKTGQPFEPDHMNGVYSNTGVMAFSIGFFFGDGIAYYIPEAIQGRPVYLFHHVLSIAIVSTTRNFTGVALQSLPQLLSIELSTAFFNIAWLCRCLSGGHVPEYVSTFLELSFAITFFILRIVNGTLMIVLIRDEVWAASQIFFGAYVMLLCLQYFWFYKILLSVFGGARKKKSKKAE